MNRSEKLKALETKQNEPQQHVITYKAEELNEALDTHLKKLSELLTQEVRIENIDKLLLQIEEFPPIKEELNELRDALNNFKFPAIPESIEVKGIELPKDKEVLIKTIESKQLNELAKKLENLTKALGKQKTASQNASDFIPYRRVIRIGNKYFFDDNPTTASAGSSTNTALIEEYLSSIDSRLTPPLSTTEPVLKKLIDDTTTTNVTYVGEAALGTATSSASWRIKKIDESTSPTSITWSGTGFTAVWNNRATTVVYT